VAKRRRRHSDTGSVCAPSTPTDLSPVALVGCDTGGRIASWNRAATDLLGWRQVDVVGRRVVEIFGRDVLIGVGGQRLHTKAVTSYGSTLDVEILTDSHPDPSGPLGGAMFAVIPQVRAESRLVADTSPRVHSWAEAAAAIQDVGGTVQCLTVGLIGVTAVNMGYSRSTGDTVLREVLTRLNRLTGDAGRPLRIAGTQFLVITPEAVQLDAERVAHEMTRPIDTQLGPVRIACCVGTATGESASAYVLLDRADSAIRRATSRGIGAVERSPREGSAPDSRHARLGSLLIDAVARREIGVQFQPLVDLATGGIVGFEALARWTSAEFGVVEPNLFIDAAEDAGLIHELGRCVLDAALDAVVHERLAGRWGESRVSVNVSAVQLAHPDIVNRITKALAERSLSASSLQLELTDTSPVDANGPAAMHLRALHHIGVRIAADDFGRGCANMAYLLDLPVDAIKIDRRFVADITTSRVHAAVIRSIISVAADLRLDVIAEGVQTAEQHLALVRLGCPLAQGFLYAPPRALEDLEYTVTLPKIARPSSIPFPLDEDGRIHRLHSADILDTPAEAAYDDIARSAAELFEAPIAMVSLVDAQRQWAKATIGPVPDHLAREASFCAHAICSAELMEVADSHEDDRFRDSPLVVDDPHVRYYAGAPLRGPNGQHYGTLCVMDVVPRTATDAQRAGLVRLADQATILLELRHRTNEGRRTLRELAVALQERDAATSALRSREHEDPLTGIENRSSLMARLEAAIDKTRSNDVRVALLVCDVDGLRLINDALGHAAGDQLLQEIAHRIQQCVRSTETVARLAGDEFAVLVPNSTESIDTLAHRILERVSEPLNISGLAQILPSISIGIAVGCGRTNADRLLLDADTAAIRARALGGGRIHTFEDELRVPTEPVVRHVPFGGDLILWTSDERASRVN
jgi:diguanylate cyclase (GGDEF)-like protein/PAS domain S-box-containing protein